MKNIILILILAALTFPAALCKGETEGGGMAGAFLQLSYSARAAGMGGAFVGVADDAEGGLINPAGVIILDKKHATASYRKMDLNRKLSFVSYAQNLKDKDAGLSLSWINVGVSEIEGRNSNGMPTGDIQYYENLIAMTFGKRIAQKLLLGVNLKYDQANLANLSANGLGFDFGVLWGENTPYRFGLAVYNVGLSHKWSTGDYWVNSGSSGSNTTDRFPVSAKLGGSYRFYQNKILVALDLEKREKQDLLPHAGAEGWANQYLALRAGYNREVVTFGAGIKVKLQKVAFTLNYAFNASSQDLDPDNLISVSAEF
jgi:hypothetical protein